MSPDANVAPPPSVSVAPARVESVNVGAVKFVASIATTEPSACSRP